MDAMVDPPHDVPRCFVRKAHNWYGSPQVPPPGLPEEAPIYKPKSSKYRGFEVARHSRRRFSMFGAKAFPAGPPAEKL